MANTDKNILITPNVGSTADQPKISFTGADNVPLALRVLDDGTVQFEGTSGQVFSVTHSMSGTIFSVSDISGIPSIEVLDTGNIFLAEFAGNVGVGTRTPTTKLDVNGTVKASGMLYSNNGAAATPTVYWDGDVNTGLYHSAGMLAFSVYGTKRVDITNRGLDLNGHALVFGYSDANNIDHVWFNDTTNMYNFVADAAYQATGNAVLVAGVFDARGANGFQGIESDSATAPSFTFTNDLNTGIYHVGADTLGITTGGVNRVSVAVATTTITNELVLQPSTATFAPFNIPHGADMTSNFTNGDIWTNTSTLVVRINGSSRSFWHNGNLTVPSQAEAEAGTSTSSRAWSSQRVAQAIDARAFTGLESVKTAAYTILKTDQGDLIVGNSATAIVFTLTAAATLATGFLVAVKNIGVGNVTITPQSGELIEGAATYVVKTNQSVLLSCSGTTFRLIATNSPEVDLSTINAAQLNGYVSNSVSSNNTIVLRDASGNVNGNFFQGTHVSVSHASAARTTDTTFYSSTDNYIRKNTAAGFKTSLGLVKGDVGLGNVDNTSDTNKPVSTVQQAALDLKADKSETYSKTANLSDLDNAITARENLKIVTLTAAAYAALATKDSQTLYFVTA